MSVAGSSPRGKVVSDTATTSASDGILSPVRADPKIDSWCNRSFPIAEEIFSSHLGRTLEALNSQR